MSIGIELVSYSRILFLDEPTSGLDSTASLEVVHCLMRLRRLGITIVCVIHQPRYAAFSCFSHLLLLTKGGKIGFFGGPREMDLYFTSLGYELTPGENVADWALDVLSGTAARSG